MKTVERGGHTFRRGMQSSVAFLVFFFFQAEDGIRDHCVTGVQTCALPILTNPTRGSRTLPVRNAATVWRIASATRSGRWLVRRFISEETLARVQDRKSVV